MNFFDPQLIIDRLKDPQFGFEKVEGAAEYANIGQLSSFRTGSLYVVLIREQNTAGDGPQARGKTVATVTFGVLAVARNFRDATGAEALKDASPVIGMVRKALLGWCAPGCTTPCKWLQGDVLDYDKNNLLWADVFSTTHVIGA